MKAENGGGEGEERVLKQPLLGGRAIVVHEYRGSKEAAEKEIQ